ncbi:MutS-like protein [Natranaerovirga pectinivora]|uniref:MutS-like protein n=1 Tax=Natranaerovirga pectinivora TaxID=682400 RepID=A0A4R3MQN6_9FIRM|nr:DNA mismatch repair protein MutS [Natranaerovirga pectinivora]TCT16206.1 MutS-like protein [Natranaerovirga pectinivora]
MKQETFELLEFNKILYMLSEYALSERSKIKIKALKPFMDESEVIREMQETTQGKKIIESIGNPHMGSTTQIEKVIALLGKDIMLLPEQFNEVKQFITTCRRMKQYLKRAESTAQEIAFYGNSIHELGVLEEEIENAIRGGIVQDRASSALANTRKKIDRLGEEIKSKIESLLRGNSGYFSESFVVTRNGRYTLPVKKEYKGQVNGTVIDTSKSGGTYFIEPSVISKKQEALSTLHIEEDNEVRRILYTLTALVEEYLPLIKVNIEAMETLDFIFAKAKLSLSMKGVPPQITTDRVIKIKGGKHPLIPEGEAVPLDFYLGDSIKEKGFVRGIVITGPNTGGKTVTLKTVGLFSLMAQSGLHIPAEEASVCMNNDIHCDIGDGQSIAENLSTFSSHMKNIIHILNTADDQSLVLLDELGSGTDPAEGMGLAIAILEEIAKKKCLLVATTHYPEIKEFAKNTQGFINARMAFDRKNLLPLYQLEIGEEGESCALYIAKRLGLEQKIIERAYAVAYRKEDVVEKKSHYDLNNLKKSSEAQLSNAQKSHSIITQPIKKQTKTKKLDPTKNIHFNIGDSVTVYPQKEVGIVYKEANEKGEIGIQIKKEKKLVNHKFVKLLISASELYPPNYDFSIIFDSADNRKARKSMTKKHDPNVTIVLEENKKGIE